VLEAGVGIEVLPRSANVCFGRLEELHVRPDGQELVLPSPGVRQLPDALDDVLGHAYLDHVLPLPCGCVEVVASREAHRGLVPDDQRRARHEGRFRDRRLRLRLHHFSAEAGGLFLGRAILGRDGGEQLAINRALAFSSGKTW